MLLAAQVVRGSAGLGFTLPTVEPIRRTVWNLVLVIWNSFVSCTLKWYDPTRALAPR